MQLSNSSTDATTFANGSTLAAADASTNEIAIDAQLRYQSNNFTPFASLAARKLGGDISQSVALDMVFVAGSANLAIMRGHCPHLGKEEQMSARNTAITSPARSGLVCAMLALAALSLAACADDDRTVAAPLPPVVVEPPPPPPPPPRAVVDFVEASDAEAAAVQAEASYRATFGSNNTPLNSPAMNLINANWLYARARKNSARFPEHYGPGTGAGVTVAVHDTGLDHTHPQFRGRVDHRSIITYGLRSGESPTGIIPRLTASEVEGITAYPSHDNPDGSGEDNDPQYIQRRDGEYRLLPTRPAYYDTEGAISGGNLGHGTAAGCLIACGRSTTGSRFQGLAYGANILVLAIRLGSGSGSFQPVDIANSSEWAGYDAEGASESAWFIQNGADVVNGSFGFPGSIDDRTRYSEARLRAAFPRLIASFAQQDTDPADRTIFVRSAGNTWGQCDQSAGDCDRDSNGRLINDAPYRATSPSLVAGLPAYISELREGQFVTAVAVNTNGSGIASFSNRCGIAADWCIAAPGSGSGIGRLLPLAGDINDGDQTVSLATTSPFSGTSAAAPYISGAIALLIDYFNGRLGNTEVVMRMLQTANNEGVYADRTIYGRGLLDLKAATEPFGNARIVTGTSLSGPAALLDASRIYTSAAFGDAWQRALSGRVLASFDELDTPFPVIMDSLVRSPRAWSGIGPHLVPHTTPGTTASTTTNVPGLHSYSAGPAQHLEQQPLGDTMSWAWAGGIHPGYAAAPQMAAIGPLGRALLAPWPGMAQNGLSASLGIAAGNLTAMQMTAWSGQGQHGIHDRPDNQGWMLSMGTAATRLEMGYMDERGALDSSGGGALGLGSGTTWFMGGRINRTLASGWQAHISGWAGVTDAAGDGVISDLRGLISSSLSAAITRSIGNGTLGILAHQPLRIEHGHADLKWIADRDRYRNLYSATTSIDLSPSGRELELAVHYSRATAAGALALAISGVKDPGHSSGSGNDLRVGIRWDSRF